MNSTQHKHRYSKWVESLQLTSDIIIPQPTVQVKWWYRYCIICGLISSRWKREVADLPFDPHKFQGEEPMTDEQEYAYWLEQQEEPSDEELDAALVALYG